MKVQTECVGDIKEEFENGRIGDMIAAEKLAKYYSIQDHPRLVS